MQSADAAYLAQTTQLRRHFVIPSTVVWWGATVGLASLVTLASLVLREDPASPTVAISGWLLLVAASYPFVRWLSGRRHTPPAFELICLSYGLHYAVSGLVLPNFYATTTGRSLFSDEELTSALLWTALGMAAMVTAYVIVSEGRVSGLIPTIDLPLSRSGLHAYLAIAVVGGGLLAASQALSAGTFGNSAIVGNLVPMLANQRLVATALLAYIVLGRRSRGHLYGLILAATVALSVGMGLVAGQLEQAFLVPVVVLMVALQMRSRLAWILPLAVAAAFLVIQPIKSEYRARTTYATYDVSLLDRLQTVSEVIVQSFDGSGPTSAAAQTDSFESIRQSLLRFDASHALVLARYLTPDLVPFYGGSTYSYLLVSWVPRPLWPDKPVALEGNIRIILDYGMITEAGLLTTMTSAGTVGEAYANFGNGGIVALMALQGVILAICVRTLSGRRNIAAQSVLIALLVYFLNAINSGTAAMYGGLIQNLAVNLALVWLVAGVKRPPAWWPTRPRAFRSV